MLSKGPLLIHQLNNPLRRILVRGIVATRQAITPTTAVEKFGRIPEI